MVDVVCVFLDAEVTSANQAVPIFAVDTSGLAFQIARIEGSDTNLRDGAMVAFVGLYVHSDEDNIALRLERGSKTEEALGAFELMEGVLLLNKAILLFLCL